LDYGTVVKAGAFAEGGCGYLIVSRFVDEDIVVE